MQVEQNLNSEAAAVVTGAPRSTQVSQLNSQSPKHALCASMIQHTFTEPAWKLSGVVEVLFYRVNPSLVTSTELWTTHLATLALKKSLQVLGNLAWKFSIMRTENFPQNLHYDKKIGAPYF